MLKCIKFRNKILHRVVFNGNYRLFFTSEHYIYYIYKLYTRVELKICDFVFDKVLHCRLSGVVEYALAWCYGDPCSTKYSTAASVVWWSTRWPDTRETQVESVRVSNQPELFPHVCLRSLNVVTFAREYHKWLRIVAMHCSSSGRR